MFRRDAFGRFDPDDFVTLLGTPSRRHLLTGLAASGLLLAAPPVLAQRLWTNPVFTADPFSLGVASGDPAEDGFVIWTKLAPEPLAEHGGMPMRAVEVAWEVAEDEGFTRVVQRGTGLARPELGHAVHVEVTGLQPDRFYAYRFTCGGVRSASGRARTFPAPVPRSRRCASAWSAASAMRTASSRPSVMWLRSASISSTTTATTSTNTARSGRETAR